MSDRTLMLQWLAERIGARYVRVPRMRNFSAWDVNNEPVTSTSDLTPYDEAIEIPWRNNERMSEGEIDWAQRIFGLPRWQEQYDAQPSSDTSLRRDSIPGCTCSKCTEHRSAPGQAVEHHQSLRGTGRCYCHDCLERRATPGMTIEQHQMLDAEHGNRGRSAPPGLNEEQQRMLDDVRQTAARIGRCECRVCSARAASQYLGRNSGRSTVPSFWGEMPAIRPDTAVIMRFPGSPEYNSVTPYQTRSNHACSGCSWFMGGDNYRKDALPICMAGNAAFNDANPPATCTEFERRE